MTGSTPTPDVHGWFQSQRHEPSNEGFTENLMRRLPPKSPLLPALAAASGVAAGFIIFAVATDWTGVANNMLHAAARVTALIPAVMPWLHAATGSALRYAAALHDQLPALAVAACAFYLAALAGLATLASALKPRI